MWTRRGFTGLVATMAVSSRAVAVGTSPISSPATSRKAEARALRAFAENTHPEGARAALDPGWRSLADKFIAGADGWSGSRYPIEALRLLSWFKDGHTTVYVPELHSGEWDLRLPIVRDVFSDGIYVTAAKEEATPLLGARITHVAGTPIEVLLRKFAEIWPSAGPALAHRWSMHAVSPGFVHAFGLMQGPPDAPIVIDGQLSNGTTVSASLKPRADGAKDRVQIARAKSELEQLAETQSFGAQPNPTENGRNFVHRMNNDRIVYVSFDRPEPLDDFSKPFELFDKEVSQALGSDRGQRLIIDLRRDGGGDNMLAEAMRKRIQRSRFNRPGGLYVLIAPHTFSAAQNFANRLERETFALFVGEPGGAPPNQYGDPKQFKGEATGLPANVSVLRWMDSSPLDTRPAIVPDVITPYTFADYLSGRDAAFDAARNHIDGRPFDDAILTAPWERPSQKQIWKPFWA